MSSDNPFASPAETASAAEPLADAPVWKQLVIRWERLRPLYNGVLAIVGLTTIAAARHPVSIELVFGVIAWGVGANLCYFGGPLAQLYASVLWGDDTPRTTSTTSRFVASTSSTSTTWLLFAAGTIFSVLATVVGGTVLAWSVLPGPQ